MAKAELSPSVPSTARWAPAPIVLSRRVSLRVSAGVVAHRLWTSAAPAMAYRLYALASRWLSPPPCSVHSDFFFGPDERTPSIPATRLSGWESFLILSAVHPKIC
jgi:hypothetical protein